MRDRVERASPDQPPREQTTTAIRISQKPESGWTILAVRTNTISATAMVRVAKLRAPGIDAAQARQEETRDPNAGVEQDGSREGLNTPASSA
jgi:hypothetical protein